MDLVSLRNNLFYLPRFQNVRDPQLYLSLVLSVIEEKILSVIGLECANNVKNPIFNYFGFETLYTYRCNRCQTSVKDRQIFKILPLLNTETKTNYTLSQLISQYIHKNIKTTRTCPKNCNSTITCVDNSLQFPRNPIIYIYSPQNNLPFTGSFTFGMTKLDLVGIMRFSDRWYTANMKTINNAWKSLNNTTNSQVFLTRPIFFDLLLIG